MMSRASLSDIDIRKAYCPAPVLPPVLDTLVLPVDKPLGWSSFDVIRTLRRVLQVHKMGHAGTLDPLATGLLLVLVGRATRLMQWFMKLPKRYEGTLRLGEATTTYDAEGEITARKDPSRIGDADLDRVRHRFLGTIRQRVPAYSAVRVGGERLYRKARRGEEVRPPDRIVTIRTFEIQERSGPEVSFHVECSKGTYIRSLAHDVGQALGVGAHLAGLRRTAIGEFSVDEAWTMNALEEAVS